MQLMKQLRCAVEAYPALQNNTINTMLKCLQALTWSSTIIEENELANDIKNEFSNVKLRTDCAKALELTRQFSLAANIYLLENEIEECARLFLMAENLSESKKIGHQIKTPMLCIKFANLLESLNEFRLAEETFRRVNDFDSIVKLKLLTLKDTERAFELIRQTKSLVSIDLGIDFCKKRGYLRNALEFSLLKRQPIAAFSLAERGDGALMSFFEQGIHFHGFYSSSDIPTSNVAIIALLEMIIIK
ncbi:hypothetical protein IE077_003919 [Cardiosporidium cionae]|uniref:Uncharacterized protein n=1 Tax=Cardiosporidium cionae TaxID=476202 RepID=A0ABQ7JED2_9APIC|nr:hypothetical protein IE077_003919 [Cardiosporidium cionae]|eukprot:KAF8822368.1 hypothetical protein IE077_003919 [Cardiosporidium cionae]